jgi:hypothetical protein
MLKIQERKLELGADISGENDGKLSLKLKVYSAFMCKFIIYIF